MLFLFALRCELLPQFSQFSLILWNNYSSYLELKFKTFLAWRHYRLPGKLGIYCFLSGSFCHSLPKGRICSLHCLLLVSNSNFNRQYMHTCEISRYLVLLWAEAFYVMLILGSQHESLIQCWLNVVPSFMKLFQHWNNFVSVYQLTVTPQKQDV